MAEASGTLNSGQRPEVLRVVHLEDDSYRVSLVRGAQEASCVVSSLHLVEDKRKQLEAALRALEAVA